MFQTLLVKRGFHFKYKLLLSLYQANHNPNIFTDIKIYSDIPAVYLLINF